MVFLKKIHVVVWLRGRPQHRHAVTAVHAGQPQPAAICWLRHNRSQLTYTCPAFLGVLLEEHPPNREAYFPATQATRTELLSKFDTRTTTTECFTVRYGQFLDLKFGSQEQSARDNSWTSSLDRKNNFLKKWQTVKDRALVYQSGYSLQQSAHFAAFWSPPKLDDGLVWWRCGRR